MVRKLASNSIVTLEDAYRNGKFVNNAHLTLFSFMFTKIFSCFIFIDIVNNEAFKDIKSQIPTTESLQDLIQRTIPYWKSTIVPCIKNGQSVLIVAHGTSLRGLVKEIEGMSNEQVNKLNLPTAIPFVYQLDAETLKPIQGKKYFSKLCFTSYFVKSARFGYLSKWSKQKKGAQVETKLSLCRKHK